MVPSMLPKPAMRTHLHKEGTRSTITGGVRGHYTLPPHFPRPTQGKGGGPLQIKRKPKGELFAPHSLSSQRSTLPKGAVLF